MSNIFKVMTFKGSVKIATRLDVISHVQKTGYPGFCVVLANIWELVLFVEIRINLYEQRMGNQLVLGINHDCITKPSVRA